MEKEEISIESPATVAGVTLVPIVKASLGRWQSKTRFSFLGFKQPIGVVVVSPQARRAFRMDGAEVPLDELTREVPGLEEILEGTRST